jgi:hypothetical protein
MTLINTLLVCNEYTYYVTWVKKWVLYRKHHLRSGFLCELNPCHCNLATVMFVTHSRWNDVGCATIWSITVRNVPRNTTLFRYEQKSRQKFSLNDNKFDFPLWEQFVPTLILLVSVQWFREHRRRLWGQQRHPWTLIWRCSTPLTLSLFIEAAQCVGWLWSGNKYFFFVNYHSNGRIKSLVYL